MNYFTPKVNMASIIGLVAVSFDVLFHHTLTTPMESFDYFIVKAFLGFLVATLFLNWRVLADDVSNIYNKTGILWASAGFSFLMSLYYRWWEYFQDVPFSVRAPDLNFLSREYVILFAGTWFIAHASFFLMGILLARKLILRKQKI